MASNDLFNSGDMFSELDKGYARNRDDAVADDDAPTEVIDRTNNEDAHEDLPGGGEPSDDELNSGEVDGFVDAGDDGDYDGDGYDESNDDDVIDYSETDERPWWDEPKYKIAGGIAVVVISVLLFAMFGGFSSSDDSAETRAGEIVEPTPLAPEEIIEQNRGSGDDEDDDGYRPELYNDDDESSSSSTPDRSLPPRDPSMYESENEPEPAPRRQPAAPVKQQPQPPRAQPAPAQPTKPQTQRSPRPPKATAPAESPKQEKPAQQQKPVKEKPSKQPIETVYQTPDRK